MNRHLAKQRTEAILHWTKGPKLHTLESAPSVHYYTSHRGLSCRKGHTLNSKAGAATLQDLTRNTLHVSFGQVGAAGCYTSGLCVICSWALGRSAPTQWSPCLHLVPRLRLQILFALTTKSHPSTYLVLSEG